MADFGARVTELLNKPEELLQLSKNAQVMARECSWDLVADKAIELLVKGFIQKHKISI